MKNKKYIILLITILIPIIIQSQTIDYRKQEWLTRDGARIDGVFNIDIHYGRPYLFAWLESGKFLTHSHPQLGSISSQIKGLFDGRNNAGTRAFLHLCRLYYQYEDTLKKYTPAIYKSLDSIMTTNSIATELHNQVDTRAWNKSLQPMRTIPPFLYYLHHPELQNKLMLWPTGAYDNISFTSPYSNITYIPGNYYNAFKLLRDWLYYAMDMWTKYGSNELDGNYLGCALHSLLVLYDLSPQNCPDGIEMRKRAKMTLDLLLLDQFMDFSANHQGGSFGRTYRYNIVHAHNRSLIYPILGIDTGDTNDDGDLYVSSYRLPRQLLNLIQLNLKSDAYYHINFENNKDIIRTSGKYTFVNKWFNLGGEGFLGDSWQLSLFSNDIRGPGIGRPFRLWIDCLENSGDPNPELENYTTMGVDRSYQYKNNLFIKSWCSTLHLHICQDGNTFEVGQNNLLKASSHTQDYFLSNTWNFFLENKTALAIKISGKTAAIEVVVISDEIADHCYSSFQAFQNAVNQNSILTDSYFKTSRSIIIGSSQMWNFPFNRIETINNSNTYLIKWESNNKMTVGTITYDFNNWTVSSYEEDTDPPNPPTNIRIIKP